MGHSKQMESGVCRSVMISGKALVITVQCAVCVAWIIQLVFHQTWRCIIPEISWVSGLSLSLGISLIPLMFSIYIMCSNIRLPGIHIRLEDLFSLTILLSAALVCWYVCSRSAAFYPVHLYGDESFHYSRVNLMVDDVRSWSRYLTGKITMPPSFRAEYMMYPALAYVPVTFWTMIFADTGQIADQRLFLFVQYFLVVFGAWIFARSIMKSWLVCLLIAFLPVTSALLISYTMSFYIELHYVGLLLIAAGLLSWGIQRKSQHIVTAAVFLASLAPIVRESALPGEAGIIISAMLWQYIFHCTQKKITALAASAGNFIIGFIPFTLYYLAKSNYTNFDKDRISLKFILQQDYFNLLQYSMLYLGPVFLAGAVFFIFRPSALGRHPWLFLSAFIGIFGGLLMQSIFIPGYMPWSRNYLIYYAAFVIVAVLAVSAFVQNDPTRKGSAVFILLVGIAVNCYFLVKYLPDNRFFNESEMVFDFSPMRNFLEKNKNAAKIKNKYIVWPPGYPAYPDKLLPEYVTLNKIEPKNLGSFPTFTLVRKLLPKNARYVLFYYMKNESKPTAFSTIPSVLRPSNLDDEGYHILSETTDPWSRNNNGVMLLEKI